MSIRKQLSCLFSLVASSGMFLTSDVRGEDALPSYVPFVRHVLNPESEFSACAVFDVDHDGHEDIFCGGFWYAGPSWKRRITRDVPNIRGRFDDYANLPLDVNGDGWVDVISVNYRSRSLYWTEHPGAKLGRWNSHLIDSPGPSETGRLVDVNGDGRLDVLPNGTDFAAWYELLQNPNEPNGDGVDWVRHPLPDGVAGHGIGFGDIDGDGIADLVTPTGWYRGLPDDSWQAMGEFRLHRDCSIPILVRDVDRDGDKDIIWGRGHGIGIYWYEQRLIAGGRHWTQHVIDSSWSSAHSLLWADLDGNGHDELIAGKRFLGHDGKDPGEWDPLVIYRYEFQPQKQVWYGQLLSHGARCGFDLDPTCADLDQDGDLDLVAPTRGGLSWLENLSVIAQTSSVGRQAASIHGMVRNTCDQPTWEYAPDEDVLEVRGARGDVDVVDTRLKWGDRRFQIRRNMEKIMGALPGPESRVPLAVTKGETQLVDGYRRTKITYSADATRRVSAFLLVPNAIENQRPAMLCLHPTHVLGKSQICGLGGKPSRFYAHELAKQGFVCLAPDYPSFGDDIDDFTDKRFVSGSMKAIWDNIRGIDLLQSLDEVDADRIGCIGHSLGGHNALFTAVFDQRIRTVVTSCGFTAFANYYNGDLRGWASDRYMPRIRTEIGLDPKRMPFDFHEVLSAIAPRPVFICAPIADSNFDVNGVRLTVSRARGVYQLFNAEESLVSHYPDASHDFPVEVRQAAYEWLAKHLQLSISSR